jgi:hypothetical protein
MKQTIKTATNAALAKGATLLEIELEAQHQSRNVGSIPFRNTIRALGMHGWLNSKDDWTRLAGALVAQQRMKQ